MKKMVSDQEINQFMDLYGFNPFHIGLRNRGFWVVEEIEREEDIAGAKVGDLCVKTRDGGDNPEDDSVYKISNFVGTSCDSFDPTFRYYYFKLKTL